MQKQALQFPANAVAVRMMGTQQLQDLPLASMGAYGWNLGPDDQNMDQLINITPSDPVGFLLVDTLGNVLGIFVSRPFTGQTPIRF